VAGQVAGKGDIHLRIGVLALQGDFEKHIKMLERCEVLAVPVRTPEEVANVDGLIIPGGESTTVGKLLGRFGVDRAIKERAKQGMPVFGTCTGMILMAKTIEGSDQPRLGLMDITVRRNAFGRQVDSFEADLSVPALGQEPVRAIFIRAPIVTEVRDGVQVLGKIGDTVVFVRQGNLLAAAFHPELTDDCRIHRLFIDMARGN